MFTFEDEFGLEEELRGKTAAVDAINAIRRGDTAEAITILEREFLPQWEDVADCEAAYREAMGFDYVERTVGREIEEAMGR